MNRKEKIKQYIKFIEVRKMELRSFLSMSFSLNLNLQVKYLQMFGCYIVSSRVRKDSKHFRTLENQEKEVNLSFMKNEEVEKEMLKSIQTKRNTLKEIALTKEWQPTPKTPHREINLKEKVKPYFKSIERYQMLIRAYLTMNDKEYQQNTL